MAARNFHGLLGCLILRTFLGSSAALGAFGLACLPELAPRFHRWFSWGSSPYCLYFEMGRWFQAAAVVEAVSDFAVDAITSRVP